MPLYTKEDFIKHVRDMVKLLRIHNIVWTYRDFLGPQWTTPPREHCILFAITEYGEVLDAVLRTNPEYQRNNKDKQPDLMGEIADMAIMITSALGPELDRASAYPESGKYTRHPGRMEAVHDAGARLTLVARKYNQMPSTLVQNELVSALGALVTSVPDIEELVFWRMEQLYEKHGKEVVVA